MFLGKSLAFFFFRKTCPVKFSDSFSRSTKKLAGYEELAGAFEPIRKRRYKILEVKKTYCREEAMDLDHGHGHGHGPFDTK